MSTENLYNTINDLFETFQENHRDFYYALSYAPRKLSKENVKFILDKPADETFIVAF